MEKTVSFEFGRYAKKVCEKVLGYDIPENDKHTLTHEESIKFLGEFTSSKIVSNTDADDLKSIDEFYKGKCVLMPFDEFDCVTIGVCHGVTIKDGEYVFLFKNVLDVYDDDCDPHISTDDEMIEIAIPNDDMLYLDVFDLGDDIICSDEDCKDVLNQVRESSNFEHFRWINIMYAIDARTHPERYDQILGLYHLKDINNNNLFDWLKNDSKENSSFTLKSMSADEYEKQDISKNELKEIMDFYKGKFISFEKDDVIYVGCVSQLSIKSKTREASVKFDYLFGFDENELIRYSKKGDLMMKLGTDFTDGFICRSVVDDETMLKVIFKHMKDLMKYVMCCFFIAEENSIDLTPVEETEEHKVIDVFEKLEKK